MVTRFLDRLRRLFKRRRAPAADSGPGLPKDPWLSDGTWRELDDDDDHPVARVAKGSFWERRAERRGYRIPSHRWWS